MSQKFSTLTCAALYEVGQSTCHLGVDIDVWAAAFGCHRHRAGSVVLRQTGISLSAGQIDVGDDCHVMGKINSVGIGLKYPVKIWARLVEAAERDKDLAPHQCQPHLHIEAQ